ncbi:hypothetical protein Tco_0536994 [Tanacetum coccineum]
MLDCNILKVKEHGREILNLVVRICHFLAVRKTFCLGGTGGRVVIGYDVLICSKYSCTFANASAQNDNASLEAGGKATIVQPQQEYWFRLSTTTVSVQVLRKNNLSLKIALNHRKKVFENFWCFILGS